MSAKKYLIKGLLSIFVLGLMPNNSKAQGYDFTFRVKNIKDTIAYLGYNFGSEKFIKDTSGVFDGDMLRFHNDTTRLPQGVYFVYAPGMYFEFIVNEPKFRIETDTADYVADMKIEGSRENKIFNNFQKFMAGKHLQNDAISGELDSLKKLNDTAAIATLRKKLTAIGDEIKAYQQNLVSSNQGTYVAKMVDAMQKPVVPDPPAGDTSKIDASRWKFYYYRKHFFDHFNLADSGLLRSPIYQPKIDEYMDELTMQVPDSIEAAADFLLKKAEPNQEVYRYLLVKLTNKYETSKIMGMEKVFLYLAENYYLKGKAYWADSALIGKFRKRVNELEPNQIGNKAPDMTLVDTLMRPVRLSDVHHRFTVLYFYNHACGHCKEATPILVDAYNKKLKDEDVAIWAADIMPDIRKASDIPSNMKMWKEFINQYHLDGWINVADPEYRDPFRKEYDVTVTPTIYILNAKHEIIAKRIGVDQIEDFIDRMIKMEKTGTAQTSLLK